jgi:hypothetical protein
MAQSLNPSFKKLTAIEIVKVSDLFRQHLAITDKGAVYADGWDDQRVVDEAIPDFPGDSLATVAKYRISLGYGKLACIKKVSSEYEEIQGQIYRVAFNAEERFCRLEDRIERLERSHFAISSAELQLRHMNNG